MDRSAQPPNPDPTRLTAAQWDIIFASEQLPPASRPSPCSEAGGEEKTTGCEGDNDKGLLPLKGLCESVVNNWNAWISWADGEGGDVWEYRIPDGLFGGDEGKGNGASAFQRLLLVKAFREDQLLRCIGRFVGEKLGEAFAERWVGSGQTTSPSPSKARARMLRAFRAVRSARASCSLALML